MMKKCNTCQEIKLLEEFSLHKVKKDGHISNFLICLRIRNKINRNKNKKNEKERVYKFLKKNPDYRKNYMKVYSKKRRKNDSQFKLINNIRARVLKFFKSKKINKNNKTLEIVGCNSEFLKNYIESKFTDGMSWDDMGKKIHIDHIIPLSSAKNKDEIYKLCHYSNLQPLWSIDNLKKGKKFK